MKNKILCAMSGGVDSAVAAYLLANSGYSVTGITLLLSDNETDASDAESLCRKLNLEHITLDLRKEFNELVKLPFCNSYINGETPNPCIVCNKQIKFGLLLDFASKNGFDKIATGHYVRKDNINGHTVLKCASDKNKDQSYMLWQLSEYQIEHSEFPLAELTKDEIRRIAAENGFVNAHKKDSQDICFVPDGDYASFIIANRNYKCSPGYYTDSDGNILGKHKGYIHYTVGQRKGLGISLGAPAYVLSKDAIKNRVVLGSNQDLFKKEIYINSLNLSHASDLSRKFDVKIRYSHKSSPATVTVIDDNRAKIEFDEPQRAPSPGQSAVFYQNESLMGGGFIE